MIGLITQNNICQTALIDLLPDFVVVPFQPDQTYEAVLMTCDESGAPIKAPIITLGVSISAESLHLNAPITPDELAQKIRTFCLCPQTTFENAHFLFQKSKRCLFLKGTNVIIPLTEKENDLLATLATVSPKTLTKEELLVAVWNYNPDAETHTVESHIHALRKKIGENADSLIRSTPSGYLLVVD